MNLKKFVRDDAAVSSVVAVLLMVAITVVLGSVVFVGVNQISDETDDRVPNIRMSIDLEDYPDSGASAREDELYITHEGGPTIEIGPAEETGTVLAGNLFIKATKPYEDDTGISGFECPHSGGLYTCSFNFDNDFSVDEDMSAGDTFKIYATEPDVDLADAKVLIVWKTEDGGDSHVLHRWTGPEYDG